MWVGNFSDNSGASFEVRITDDGLSNKEGMSFPINLFDFVKYKYLAFTSYSALSGNHASAFYSPLHLLILEGGGDFPIIKFGQHDTNGAIYVETGFQVRFGETGPQSEITSPAGLITPLSMIRLGYLLPLETSWQLDLKYGGEYVQEDIGSTGVVFSSLTFGINYLFNFSNTKKPDAGND